MEREGGKKGEKLFVSDDSESTGSLVVSVVTKVVRDGYLQSIAQTFWLASEKRQSFYLKCSESLLSKHS